MFVATYSRVSTEEQAQGKTIESQVTKNKNFCDARGLEVYKNYLDEGWTGTIVERPALNELIEDAKAGKFESVVCCALDRIARGGFSYFAVTEKLLEAGVRVSFIETPMDEENRDLLETIYAGIAGQERKNILTRCSRGKREKVEIRKQYMGGIPSYGYSYIPKNKFQKEDGHLEIRTEEAQIVKLMFQWVGRENTSAREVVRRLTDMKIPTRKGLAIWSRSSVNRILKNENYVGTFPYYRRKNVETTHHRNEIKYRKTLKTGRKMRPREEWVILSFPELRLIEDDIFFAVQERLRRNRAFSKRNSKNSYLLSGGMIKCGKCGSSYYGTSAHGIPVYKDGNKTKRFPLPKNCDSPSISASRIEEEVWSFAVRFLKSKSFLDKAAKNLDVLDEGLSDLQNTVMALEERFGDLLLEEKRLINAVQKGVFTEDQVEAQMRQVSADKLEISGKLGVLKQKVVQEKANSKTILEPSPLLTKIKGRLNKLSFEERQEVVRLLVKEIRYDGEKWIIKSPIPRLEIKTIL